MTTVATRTTAGGMIAPAMASVTRGRMVTENESITRHMATGKECIIHRQSSTHHRHRQASVSFYRHSISTSKEIVLPQSPLF